MNCISITPIAKEQIWSRNVCGSPILQFIPFKLNFSINFDNQFLLIIRFSVFFQLVIFQKILFNLSKAPNIVKLLNVLMNAVFKWNSWLESFDKLGTEIYLFSYFSGTISAGQDFRAEFNPDVWRCHKRCQNKTVASC